MITNITQLLYVTLLFGTLLMVVFRSDTEPTEQSIVTMEWGNVCPSPPPAKVMTLVLGLQLYAVSKYKKSYRFLHRLPSKINSSNCSSFLLFYCMLSPVCQSFRFPHCSLPHQAVLIQQIIHNGSTCQANKRKKKKAKLPIKFLNKTINSN